MKKRRVKNVVPAGYLTVGRCVYLGRAGKRVRSNAMAAGLIVINAKAMRKKVKSMMAIQRINSEGSWHDTVRY